MTEEVRSAEADPETLGQRVDAWAVRLWPDLSRARIQGLIGAGKLTLDGAPVKAASEKVRAGTYALTLPPPEPAAPIPEAIPLTVAFEDEHLIVVNKAAGMAMHPAPGAMRGTLVHALLAHCGASLSGIGGVARPGIVHRIDKDTSGLLVVAKDERTREGLKVQLAAHTVERAYLAITVGVPASGTIRTLHGRDPKSRLRFSSRVREGKTAVTHVRVLERLAGGRAALVECRLETGRTHQIRVHLTEQTKTPLLADAVYGRATPPSPDLAPIAAALGRQALHAAVLGFLHPITNEQLHFESPLPNELEAALGALRALG
jgi:23S rRNA pseudouridine1911/1915/1917 synthase